MAQAIFNSSPALQILANNPAYSFVKASAMTSNGTVTIPSGCYIVGVFIENTTANAITGGLKIGTTNGGVDVVLAIAIGASSLVNIPDATLLKRTFSTSIDTALYIQTVTLWNNASVNIWFLTAKLP